MGDGTRAGMETARGALGRRGEDAALDWYRGAGFVLVARNWRCPAGELDLVLRRGGLVVFCEVKTRGGAGFGGGHEAVTWRKQRKLRQLAEIFLAGLRAAPAAVRFDVASVLARPGMRPAVEVFEDAF
ncbi:MAG: YraN family protein [Actinomycetota bacterium]|nr:YraN family protein [Actinomycetota bacterium]